MPYSKDLREKAINLLEKGMSKLEVSNFLNISLSSLYRWNKKKSNGEDLAAKKKSNVFFKKQIPKLIVEYI